MFRLPWQAQEDAAPTKAAPQPAVQSAPAAAQGSKSAQVKALEYSAGFHRVAVHQKVVVITANRPCSSVHRSSVSCGALKRVRGKA